MRSESKVARRLPILDVTGAQGGLPVTPLRLFAFGALIVVTSLCQVNAQSVIFDNMTHSVNNNMPLLPEWLNDSVEAGDEVWLAGSDRTVTELRLLFTYRGTIPGTIDAQIRFRSIREEDQTPGAVIYDSGIIAGLPTLAGFNEYTFNIPNVDVPDRFVWTVQAYNRQGSVGELGPSYFNPATVGFSDDFFWRSGGSDWTPYSWGGDPYANFAAQITAVPEPATMIALTAGLGLLARRRKKASR